MSAAAKKPAPLPDLPPQPQVGDRIRLKEEKVFEYTQACEAAGWTLDLNAIRIVIREDKFNPGGGRRLFVEGPPFAFASMDVQLAWNTEDERRRELRRRGWKV
jgi:hypothetical protein